MALGFQLHVTDVYLEELAKASVTSESNSEQRYEKKVNRNQEKTENRSFWYCRIFLNIFNIYIVSRLTDELIQMLLKPFINELTWGKEERLLSQIEVRVFDHLIRQSDVAIAYEEDEDEDNDEMEDESTLETDIDNSDTNTEEQFSFKDADPRAGQGDIVLPQLKIDYEKIAKIVLEAGSKKEVHLIKYFIHILFIKLYPPPPFTQRYMCTMRL